jgi:hypothetical protein
MMNESNSQYESEKSLPNHGAGVDRVAASYVGLFGLNNRIMQAGLARQLSLSLGALKINAHLHYGVRQ